MPTHAAIAAIILAAGSSSRMGDGRHKLLLPLGEKPVLAHVISATLASQAHPIIVVLGHQAEQVRTQIADFTTIISVENPDYQQGMSSSLRTGIQTLQKHTLQQAFPSINGALILLGDQPLMTTAIIDALIACKMATGKLIVAPSYNGRRGNPVLFDASLFPALMAIRGDEGARSVIEHHRAEVATIELSNAMPSYDVDTWDAYQTVLVEWEKKEKQKSNEHHE